MDSRTFDDLARRFGNRISRRSALKALVGGVAAVTGGALLTEQAGAACMPVGSRCNRNAACCSGTCRWTVRQRGLRRMRVGACVLAEVGESCRGDEFCTTGACYAGTCIEKRDLFQPCDSNGDCSTGLCNLPTGTCSLAAYLGWACADPSVGAPQFVCDPAPEYNYACCQGFCMQLGGSSCTQGNQCCGGCDNGTCLPYVV